MQRRHRHVRRGSLKDSLSTPYVSAPQLIAPRSSNRRPDHRTFTNPLPRFHYNRYLDTNGNNLRAGTSEDADRENDKVVLPVRYSQFEVRAAKMVAMSGLLGTVGGHLGNCAVVPF